MKVKYFICLLISFFIGVSFVFAGTGSLAMVGDKYYDSLEEAIEGASRYDIIMLIDDVVVDDSLVIDKHVNINLNGHDIVGDEKVFVVKGGTLDIVGQGTIRESSPNYGAIMVIGSDDVNDSSYSVVNIGEDVILEGWSGIFITHDNTKSYGVVVNLAGDINTVNDINGGTGAGIYVNGNIKDSSNSPVINIKDGSKIVSTGNGLYIAGYATFNIGKAYISGMESGIGIKAGVLNIDGASIACKGEDNTPTFGYNNGIKASGTAIQIESNDGYAGDIVLNIEDGSFWSLNSNVIYEYIGKGNSSLVKDIDISGGTFVSGGNKGVFSFSDSFNIKHKGFVSGGKYSTDPKEYISNEYVTVVEDDFYNVIKTTLKEVSSDNVVITDDSFINVVLGIIGIIIFFIVGYVNRLKIFSWFKKRLNK